MRKGNSAKRHMVARPAAAMVSFVMVSSVMGAHAVPAFANAAGATLSPNAGTSASECQGTSTVQGDVVELETVEGEFSYEQTVITPNEKIARVFAAAASALCGGQDSRDAMVKNNPLGWQLKVSGNVQNEFVATVDELASERSVDQTMTCSCGGNPSDGLGIITADVKGIPVSYLVERAGAASDANAITFIASDGTEVSMPLSYAVARHGVISYEVNGEDLSASVGGNNQLWLSRTSANYFVRDIVEVRITHEDMTPAAPGQDMSYPNNPNVGFMGAAQ